MFANSFLISARPWASLLTSECRAVSGVGVGVGGWLSVPPPPWVPEKYIYFVNWTHPRMAWQLGTSCNPCCNHPPPRINLWIRPWGVYMWLSENNWRGQTNSYYKHWSTWIHLSSKQLVSAEKNTKLELLSPSTTYPLLHQSKGWQFRMEHLWLQMNLTPSWISWRYCTHQ